MSKAIHFIAVCACASLVSMSGGTVFASSELIVLEVPVEAEQAEQPDQGALTSVELIETKKKKPDTEPAVEAQVNASKQAPYEPRVPEQDEKISETPVPVQAVAAVPVEDSDPDLFFDAEDLLPPHSEMVPVAPRKVDPTLEPASRFVVVEEGAKANSKKASFVSAERAIKLGRYESAIEILDELRVKNSRDPNVLMSLAQAYQKSGQKDKAIETYDQLLAIAPKNIDAEVNMLGLVAQSYPSVSLQRLLELHDKNARHVGVIAQIAVVQASMGRYDEAIKYLGVAASKEPKNANHLFNMAVIADRIGRRSEAVRYYEEALEVDTVYGGGRTIPRDAVYERLANLR